MMEAFFLVLAFVYCLLLSLAIYKWRAMLGSNRKMHDEAYVFISVLIPARNESSRIPQLLKSLASQRYPAQSYEVILIDDHSEDQTIALAQDVALALSLPFRCIRLSEANLAGKVLKGKKAALQQGIENAKGEVIVTTDADCTMGEGWLQSIHYYFTNHAAKMVVGPVTFVEDPRLFSRLQTIELAALIGTGAVSLAYGRPNMCNGANLAFSKSAFESVGGYTDNMHIPSGDDEFLLQKIYRRFPDQVFFNVHPEGFVSTYPADSLKAFISQRKRWGGKWRLHKGVGVKLMAVFVFSFHLMYLIAFGAIMLGAFSPVLFGGVVVLKAILEYFFLKGVMRHMGKSLYMKHFVFLQAVYSWYVAAFGLLVNFGAFEWKGRVYGKND